ncbi:flagellar hook-length control protein FliK [Vibrio profundi]|uniref:flagellar hook-length control protein FliK n=1 Tax=Vibrio profundi TaxID=1774960 RepID=UPI003736D10E
MNISLPTTSSTSKTALASEAGGSDFKLGESGESKGFLETLTDVFSSKEGNPVEGKGETEVIKTEKASSTEGKSSKESTEVEEGQVSEAKAKVSGDDVEIATDDASTEAVLKAKTGAELDVESGSKTQLEQTEAKKDVGAVSQEQVQSNAKVNLDHSSATAVESKDIESASKATVAMNEGNKLLGQLDEANKTLQPQNYKQIESTDGKALPQAQQIDMTEAATVTATVTTTVTGDNSGEITKNNGQASSQVSEDVPESLQRFIEPEQGEKQALEGEVAINAAAVSGATAQAVSTNQLKSVNSNEIVNTKLVSPQAATVASEVNRPMTAEQIQHLVAESSTTASPEIVTAVGVAAGVATQSNSNEPSISQVSPEQLAIAVQQVQAQIVEVEQVASEILIKEASGQPLTQKEQQTLATANTELVKLNDQLEFLVTAPELSNTELPPEAAIAWGAQPVSDVKVAATDNQLATKAAQTGVAASVHQVLNQQAQAATASDKSVMQSATQTSASPSAATLDPTSLATNPSIAPVSVGKSASSEAMLKAGAAGVAAASLSRGQSKDDSKESTLAQQISAASGQQGVSTSTPTRAEIQAMQQAPLQLTKELANEQVAEKVQMMMSKNLKNLDIRLDPPELGRMQIRMTMNNDVANVHFTVSNPQAREIIEQTIPRLREMLAQQGMQLSDSSVQQQASGQQRDGYNSAGNGGQEGNNSTNGVQGDENLDSDINLELNVASKRDGISYYA